MRVLVFLLLAAAVLAGPRPNPLVEAARASTARPSGVPVRTRVPVPQSFRFVRDPSVQLGATITGAYADPSTNVIHLGPENRGHKFDRSDEFTAAHEMAHRHDAWRVAFPVGVVRRLLRGVSDPAATG
jgi:hypothetical protein